MLRVAIFGLGTVAERIHLPACAFLPEVEVVAACEPDVERRVGVGGRFGIRTLYADPESLLEKEKPDIAIIGTPPHLHRDLCLLALGHGAHVLCEKPFVGSVAEADEVIVAAERYQRTVWVNNQYRFMKIYCDAQARVVSGEFGSPFLIQCWQQMFHPPSIERNWRAQLVRYTLYEFGTHPLDLICFFFGALPLSITAHTLCPRADTEADVVVQATLRFPGERLATLLCNRVSHACQRYLEMRVDCEKASLRVSFGGLARATVEWSGVLSRPITRLSLVKGGEARIEAAGRSRVITTERSEGRARATALNLRALIDTIQKGTMSTDQARHARELIRIVCAGYESAKTGETVWLRSLGYDNEHANDIGSDRIPQRAGEC
jgi:predicted dehydrogenase